MRMTPRSLLSAGTVLVSLTVAGCGSSSSDSGSNALAQQQQIQQARSDAARAQREEDRIKALEQKVKQAGGSKSSGGQTPPTDSSSTSSGSSSSVNFSSCDANIDAAGGASCAFAQNTFYEYFNHQGDGSFPVYSPTTGSTYTVSCGPNGDNVVCTNDRGAATRFSQAAVGAYSQAQADHYAATHDVGH